MRRQPIPRYALAAAMVLVLAEAALAAGLRPARDFFYLLVWWPYVALADGLVKARRGASPATATPAGLAALAFWSVSFWLVFEAYNLVLGNWRYVGLVAARPVRWAGYVLSFATVLPAVLVTAGWFETLRPFRRLAVPRFAWTPRRRLAAGLAGVAAAALPLIQPRWAYPLVWVGPFLVLDAAVDALGGPGLVRCLAAGRGGRVAALLAAGLFCGLLWEFWNYWAGAKWVYHVPLPRVLDVRLFEMPLPGFLGFLPFALECEAAARLLSALGLLPPVEGL
ncbi:hypothetical protein G3N55_06440, partial [Dissulfurirhabdus thermomarina]